MPPRPWYRLHALTWLVLLVVIAACLVMNFAVEADRLNPPHGHHTDGTLHFGWPLLFVENKPKWDPPWWDQPAWIRQKWFNPLEVRKVSVLALTLDVLIAVAIVGGASWSVERCLRRFPTMRSQGVKHLFVGMSWMACFVALKLQSYAQGKRLAFEPTMATVFAFDSLTQLATMIAYGSIAFAWLAFFDVTGVVWKRIADRRQEG